MLDKAKLEKDLQDTMKKMKGIDKGIDEQEWQKGYNAAMQTYIDNATTVLFLNIPPAPIPDPFKFGVDNTPTTVNNMALQITNYLLSLVTGKGSATSGTCAASVPAMQTAFIAETLSIQAKNEGDYKELADAIHNFVSGTIFICVLSAGGTSPDQLV